VSGLRLRIMEGVAFAVLVSDATHLTLQSPSSTDMYQRYPAPCHAKMMHLDPSVVDVTDSLAGKSNVAIELE
jgi:hypothetical protein